MFDALFVIFQTSTIVWVIKMWRRQITGLNLFHYEICSYIAELL